MAQNPFDDDDRTVLLPNPGGRKQAQVTPPQPNPEQAWQIPPTALQPDLVSLNAHATNKLLACAGPLLSLSARLRQMLNYPALDALKQSLVKDIAEFEKRALQGGVLAEHVKAASYVICTYMDEVIQNTPWGAKSNWGHMCLLISIHREAWGGERFFQVVDQAVKLPAQNIQLIELCYVLISFGFAGKYRVIANGLNELETVKLELYQIIQRQRGDLAVELSPHWQGQNSGAQSLSGQFPAWISFALAASLLVLAYLGFLVTLNAVADPVYKQLLNLSKEPQQLNIASPAPVAVSNPVRASQRFVPLLSEEIAQNQVEVVDDRILRIRNAFASGSDQIKPEFLPMLKKIAKELENGQDSAVITGHTDDKAIVSAKFPSNWYLSTARAKNVLSVMLAEAQLQGHLRAEGRADGEPLVSNDTAEHRAFNRRVDILIK